MIRDMSTIVSKKAIREFYKGIVAWREAIPGLGKIKVKEIDRAGTIYVSIDLLTKKEFEEFGRCRRDILPNVTFVVYPDTCTFRRCVYGKLGASPYDLEHRENLDGPNDPYRTGFDWTHENMRTVQNIVGTLDNWDKKPRVDYDTVRYKYESLEDLVEKMVGFTNIVFQSLVKYCGSLKQLKEVGEGVLESELK